MSKNMNQQLIEAVVLSFKERYHAEPELLVQAPGRVNLIGEHTDYNDGFVLPCAINYQTIVAAKRRDDEEIRVVAVDYENQEDQFDLVNPIVTHPEYMWANYIRGVVKYLKEDGYQFGGMDLSISGNVPQGAGLSSSASLEVVIGQTIKSLYQLDISQKKIALNGQKAENKFVGCNCGIMDQLISAKGESGHALLIDCRTLETESISIPKELSVMIINSNVKRGLVDSEYNTRREQCEQAVTFFRTIDPKIVALRDLALPLLLENKDHLDPIVFKRAHHVISENQRTLEASKALKEGDVKTLGQLMAASHLSMKNDFEITIPAIDFIVELIKSVVGEQGGVRMTGGGFGGCVVALVPHELVKKAEQALLAHYQLETGLEATIYVCSASSGSGIVQD